ncbi:MAG TPA: DUF4163 domain-containing protein [Clostridia bacterium]|nr:DUF4163 domain-containing protein [Clostridia bacterium]
MKKVSCIVILSFITILLAGSVILAGEMRYPVELEGNKIEGQAFESDGVLYLPLRTICSHLGYKVDWHGKENTIEINNDGFTIDLSLEGYNQYEYHSGDLYKTEKGRTYVNKRFFEKDLGLKVKQLEGTVLVSSIKENPISIEKITDISDTDEILITLHYPQIEGLEDSVQDKLNQFFKKKAEDAKNHGLKNAEEMRKFKESGYGSPHRCETYFDYAVKYNQNGLLSILFSDYQYAGGAHGITVQSSATFDLATGKEYKLQDLFSEGSDHVSLISDEVKKLMQKQGITESLLNPFNAIRPDQDFYLTNGALVVYFQAYEYLPYAAGIPEFAVEYQILQDHFRPEFEILN